jgi:pSer/pThr/pTyr-binding forkhead associated (FHA) protein
MFLNPLCFFSPLQVVIGRAKEATFNIADIQISRIHAIFRFTMNKWTIESVVRENNYKLCLQ